VRNKMAQAPGFGGWDTYNTFDKKNQEDFSAWYEKQYAGQTSKPETSRTEWKAPAGYSDHLDHHSNFYHAIRTNGKVQENAEFGFRAAAAGLASNKSLFEQRIIKWDPVKMKLA
jgi:hypothetical protein